MQDNWQWCRRCGGLAFFGNGALGACPAGGEHDHTGSGNYGLPQVTDGAAGQNNWRWCVRCQGLYFIGNGSHGRCPAGGAHTEAGSGDYVLTSADPGQHGWRWCGQCQGLFFSGNGWLGVCPAGGAHSTAGSGDYVLTILNAPAVPPVFDVVVTNTSTNNFLVTWVVEDAVLPLVETFEIWETTGPGPPRLVGAERPTDLRQSLPVLESDFFLTDHAFTVYIRNGYGRSAGVEGRAHNSGPPPPPPPPVGRTTLTATLDGTWQTAVTPNPDTMFVEVASGGSTPFRVNLARSGPNWAATVPATDGPPGSWTVTFHAQGVFANGESTGDIVSPTFEMSWMMRGIAIFAPLDSTGSDTLPEYGAPTVLNE